MTYLEIALLILLSVSLVANYRLWQLFRCYKEAYKMAALKYEPDIFSRIGQLTMPLAVCAILYMAHKNLKQEGVL